MDPQLEVIGNGWRASFQRRIGSGIGSNRGALPYHDLGGDDLRQRVLVPLREQEALWIAFTVEPNISIAAAAANAMPVRLQTLSTSPRETMLAADALMVGGDARPIDATLILPAATRSETAQNDLTFDMTTEAGDVAGQLGVVLAVPALYEAMSGKSAPQATTLDDAYRGWRMP